MSLMQGKSIFVRANAHCTIQSDPTNHQLGDRVAGTRGQQIVLSRSGPGERSRRRTTSHVESTKSCNLIAAVFKDKVPACLLSFYLKSAMRSKNSRLKGLHWEDALQKE